MRHCTDEVTFATVFYYPAFIIETRTVASPCGTGTAI
jgi:hypothetical protein